MAPNLFSVLVLLRRLADTIPRLLIDLAPPLILLFVVLA